jgi:tripartite ATP-independent transporter DctM subunit
MTIVAVLLVVAVCAALLAGYPVAFTLGGVSLLFGLLGVALGAFRPDDLAIIGNRLFGTMTNETLMAVPLFVFMGVMLERARIAEQLLESMAALFGALRGGLGISVVLVGGLLAASTGIVGATVVTMGLLSLPTMLRRGYDPALATGTICAAGTLGQIIPPSIILVLLGDVISSAYTEAQNTLGHYSGETVSVGDLFAGALLPGLALVGLYVLYLAAQALWHPQRSPAIPHDDRAAMRKAGLVRNLLAGLLPALLLIVAVLGSILAGFATPTEAAAVGAIGAMLLAVLRGQFTVPRLREVTLNTAQVSSMVFMILLGASMFSLVFNAYGGDRLVQGLLQNLPGGAFGAMVAVMGVMFLLGFIIDFIEIIFIVVPVVAPVLLAMGLDPVWLGVMMAVNLQTSFLTPPFGFALFYLRGVAPPEIATAQIYRGVVPFIVLQLAMLAILAFWPALATWLPKVVYAS